jgi:hypothetical protein
MFVCDVSFPFACITHITKHFELLNYRNNLRICDVTYGVSTYAPYIVGYVAYENI